MDFVKAGLDDLIPFIFAIFWIIAQIIGGSKKKKTGRTQPFETPVNTPEPESFNDFVRKLSEQTEPFMPEPEQAEEPSVTTLPDIPSPADAQPIQAKASISRPVELDIPEKIEDLYELKTKPRMSAFHAALPTMKFPSMSLRLTRSAHNLISDESEQNQEIQQLKKRLGLDNRTALRQAMINHVILGTPKGLEGLESGTAG